MTIAPVIPLIGSRLLQAHRDPTQRSLEARLRNARYIAELTKFRLAPVGTFFSLLKGLLDDFGGHNVDAAAALVETAGRFLLCLPEAQTRISNMLDVSQGPCWTCFGGIYNLTSHCSAS